jgi:hypothetical protein
MDEAAKFPLFTSTKIALADSVPKSIPIVKNFIVLKVCLLKDEVFYEM